MEQCNQDQLWRTEYCVSASTPVPALQLKCRNCRHVFAQKCFADKLGSHARGGAVKLPRIAPNNAKLSFLIHGLV
jgi:hypothetical protein